MGLSLLCDLPGTVSAGGCEKPPVLAATPCASPAAHAAPEQGALGKGGSDREPQSAAVLSGMAQRLAGTDHTGDF